MRSMDDLLKYAEDRQVQCRSMLDRIGSNSYGRAMWRGRLAEVETMLETIKQAIRNSKRKRAA